MLIHCPDFLRLAPPKSGLQHPLCPTFCHLPPLYAAVERKVNGFPLAEQRLSIEITTRLNYSNNEGLRATTRCETPSIRSTWRDLTYDRSIRGRVYVAVRRIADGRADARDAECRNVHAVDIKGLCGPRHPTSARTPALVGRRKRASMTIGRKRQNPAAAAKNRGRGAILDDFCNIPGCGEAADSMFRTRIRTATVDLNERWRRGWARRESPPCDHQRPARAARAAASP